MRASQPGPQGQAPTATRWRWLLPLGGLAVLLTLLAFPQGSPPGMVLSYSRFQTAVGAGTVRAVTIDPAGQVAGTPATGQPFTTTIPVALDDRALAGRLAAHHVQVTATAAMPSSPLPGLIGLLPLLLLGGFILFAVRSARRQAATLGGLGGAGTLTKAKTRVIGAERPATRFADGHQVAYNGHLLYTFTTDRPGQVTGQGFQNFFVVTPGLAPLTNSAAPGGAVPAAPSGGYGY